mgnify:CR=1 FL=1
MILSGINISQVLLLLNEWQYKEKTSDAPRAQLSFALQAYLKTSSVDAEVVYSRSMFPGSHIAAYLYKRRHPNVIWYAEFSDPIAYTSSGTKRI